MPECAPMSLEGRGDDLLLLVRGQLSLTDFEPLGTPSHVETLSMQGIRPQQRPHSRTASHRKGKSQANRYPPRSRVAALDREIRKRDM